MGQLLRPGPVAAVPAQVSDFPLAVGILGAAVAWLSRLASRSSWAYVHERSARRRCSVRHWQPRPARPGGRVGTGTGFTIAQLSLLVNASIGVRVFHVPEPGTRQARKVLAGAVLAGIGGCVIAMMR